MREEIIGAIGVIGFVLAFGMLAWWLNWDDADDSPVRYEIQVAPVKPAKFIKV